MRNGGGGIFYFDTNMLAEAQRTYAGRWREHMAGRDARRGTLKYGWIFGFGGNRQTAAVEIRRSTVLPRESHETRSRTGFPCFRPLSVTSVSFFSKRRARAKHAAAASTRYTGGTRARSLCVRARALPPSAFSNGSRTLRRAGGGRAGGAGSGNENGVCCAALTVVSGISHG